MDVESEFAPFIVSKWRHACDAFREEYPFKLEPGEDGAPDFGYDFDPFLYHRRVLRKVRSAAK